MNTLPGSVQILTLLAIAFFIVYIVEFFIFTQTKSKKKYKKTIVKTTRKEEKEFHNEKPKPIPSDLVLNQLKNKKDDLILIEGIGEKTNELLNNQGINTFSQIKRMSKEELEEILEKGGSRFKLLNPASWPKQASLADEGRWEELSSYQKRLINSVEYKD